MKKLFTISCFLIVVLANAQTPTAADFKKLSWLDGTWNRTNAKPGRSGLETWTKISETEWKGLGISLTGKDTAFVEKLKLVVKGDNIFYVADVPENKLPVEFKFTLLTDHSFVCENPKHDFPKKITYVREGNKIKATISGNGKSQDYLFEKK